MKIWTSWRDYPRAILGIAEPELCRWLVENVKPGETWIDVGAHHGVTALVLSRSVGTRGRVFAFEPVLSSAGLLSATRVANGLTQLTVVPLALGETERMSLLRVSQQWHGMIGITPGMRTQAWSGNGETVLDVAFDSVWPRLCGDAARIHGVKIDAQGSESYVIRGMCRALQEFTPRLVVEWHQYADIDEFHRTLESVGYSPLGYDVERTSGRPTSRLSHGRTYEFRIAG